MVDEMFTEIEKELKGYRSLRDGGVSDEEEWGLSDEEERGLTRLNMRCVWPSPAPRCCWRY